MRRCSPAIAHLGRTFAAFLDAVDERINSNTLLCVVQLDDAVSTLEDAKRAIAAWVNSSVFAAHLAEAEGLREWSNGAGGAVRPLRAAPLATALGAVGFVKRLWWLLQIAPSPYNKPLSPFKAQRLVENFVRGFFEFPFVEHILPLPTSIEALFDSQAHFFDVSVDSLNLKLPGYFYRKGA